MVNLIHTCEKMTHQWMSEKDIRIPIRAFTKFANNNCFHVEQKEVNGEHFFKLFRTSVPIFEIKNDFEDSSFRFMDMSDIHIGHPKFDEDALRNTLQQALDEGIKLVFIAGDVFEGTFEQLEYNYKILNDQVDLAYSIFKDYPLSYHVINGNHDYTFEQVSLRNPIAMLATRLQQDGIDFNFYNYYLVDFVFCGVIKRMMHVEGQNFSKRRIFAELKIKQFEREGLLTNYFNGIPYRVRFFHAGHVHVNVQMYYNGIYISHAGSFISTEYMQNRANIIQGRIVSQKVFLT